jgi:S-phase kinase-associated protein 1
MAADNADNANNNDIISLDEDVYTVTLISGDDQRFEDLSKSAVFLSELVSTSLSGDNKLNEVNIPNVKGEIMKYVIDYMKHHGKKIEDDKNKAYVPETIPKPLKSKIMKDVCADEWDAEFVDQFDDKKQVLYDLILAANYMDIKPLLHLGCAKVASLIKGEPLEKIKAILNPTVAENDETADAEAADAEAAADE